jgi:hypothetical protein
MDLMAFAERWGLPAVIVLVVLFRTIPQMLKSFKEEMAAERQQCAAFHREQMSEHQQTRHEVKQWAHVAGLRKAIEEAKARQAPDAQP